MENADPRGVVLDFGKHRGVLLTETPAGYLTWMANEGGLSKTWRGLAKIELDRRSTERELDSSRHRVL